MNDSDKNMDINDEIAYSLVMLYFLVQYKFLNYPKREICDFLGHEKYFAPKIEKACSCMNNNELPFLFFIYSGGKNYDVKITDSLRFKLCGKDGFKGSPQLYITARYYDINGKSIVDVKCGKSHGKYNETYDKVIETINEKIDSCGGYISVAMICIICIFLNMQKHEKGEKNTIHEVLNEIGITDNQNDSFDIGNILMGFKEALYTSCEAYYNKKTVVQQILTIRIPTAL